MERIEGCGKTFSITVVDEESDGISAQHRPFLVRVSKAEGGYGFYLWYDEAGHYVEEVTDGSPAEKAGEIYSLYTLLYRIYTIDRAPSASLLFQLVIES